MSGIQDDKAPHVIPFIVDALRRFRESQVTQDENRPFFIGLNGVQGAGKSVLVSILLEILTSEPHNLPTVVFSLDDLYLTHEDQVALAQRHAGNPLLQHRGQPGTHDIVLAEKVFSSLKRGLPTKIPQYDKATFNGQGDRVPETQWETVNSGPEHKTRVVLFEGWCVGFRPLPDDVLESKHGHAVQAATTDGANYRGRLGHNGLQSVVDINEALKRYDSLTDQLDAFIHIDAADPLYVYRWRLQQERQLREIKGGGMTDDQVEKFVDGYYPAYELYTETLRQGIFRPSNLADGAQAWKEQLRLVVNEDRKVVDAVKIQ